MAAPFTVTPEHEASTSQFLRRQLLFTPPLISPNDVNLRGKTIIVTGANSGIGLHLCHQLLDLGLAKLILAVRNEPSGHAAAAALAASHPSLPPDALEVWHLDLALYPSITSFAARAARDLPQLHNVILNAGIYRWRQVLNPHTGHDEDIQTNYLSNVLLTILLLPILKAKNNPDSPGRITLVSSDTSAWAKFEERHAEQILPAFDEITDKWEFQERYSTSKLLGQLFLAELARRVPVEAAAAVVNCVNPGLCYGSNLARDGYGTLFGKVFYGAVCVIGREANLGARNLAHAAVSVGGKESHGRYVQDCEVRPMAPIVYTSEGKEVAARLWKETMKELSFAGVEEIVDRLGDGK
ncbi:hypothetical protein B0T17DRAFT_352521 [Bombardia bombarda]|uniref:NAD(P)-binding protein n=1 Tax=Bombardia bombarda TaxID=252184 RepID=A0AA39WHX4_9PEZI|nr:hypothetical protein B0T17DRAFT_352521 [Bombardia bombarda]